MRNVNAFLIAGLLFAMVAFENVAGKKMSMDDAKKALRTLRSVCMSKTGATADVLDKALAGEFLEDNKFQCYLKCILTMSKSMKNDKFRANVMIRQTELMLFEDDAARVIKAINACSGPEIVTSEDGCVAAWQFCKCYMAADSEAYMLP